MSACASPGGGWAERLRRGFMHCTEECEVGLKGMQTNVKKMQGQLERIAGAKTDDERQKVMAAPMQTMQENMQMARGMQAGMMGMMMGAGGPAGGSDERLQRMEKRMDMMEMMMRSGGQGMPGMGKP